MYEINLGRGQKTSLLKILTGQLKKNYKSKVLLPSSV